MKIKNEYLNKMIKKCYMCKSNTFRDQRCISEFGNPNTDVDCYNPHPENIKIYMNTIHYNNKIYWNPKAIDIRDRMGYYLLRKV